MDKKPPAYYLQRIAIIGGICAAAFLGYFFLSRPQTITMFSSRANQPAARFGDLPVEEAQESDQYATKDWSAYRNEKYRFEARYPSSWKAVDGELSDEYVKYSGKDPANGKAVIWYAFVRSEEKYASLEDFMKRLDAENRKNLDVNMEIRNETRMRAGGVEGWKREGSLASSIGTVNTMQTFFLVGGVVYEFAFELSDAATDEERALYGTMLAMLSFEKTGSAAPFPSAASSVVKQFSPPYAVSWRVGAAEAAVKGASLGEGIVPRGMSFQGKDASGTLRTYLSGSKAYMLILDIGVSYPPSASARLDLGRSIGVKRIANEFGDEASEDGSTAYASDGNPGVCAVSCGQYVYFLVPAGEKQFTLRSGGLDNAFFNIGVDASGTITAEKALLEG